MIKQIKCSSNNQSPFKSAVYILWQKRIQNVCAETCFMVNLQPWVAQGLNSYALQPNRKLQFKGTPTNKAQEELKWCSVICDATGTVKVSGWSFLLDENHAQRDSHRAPCDLRGAGPRNQMFWQKLRASCTYFTVLLGILLQWPCRKQTFHFNYIILENKNKTKRQKMLLKLRTRLFQETNKRHRCSTST